MTETRRRYAQSNMDPPDDEESLLPSGPSKRGSESKAKRYAKVESSRDPGLVILGVLVMCLAFLFGLVYWIL